MDSYKKAEGSSSHDTSANFANVPNGYEEHSAEIATFMGWFFLRYLGRIYNKFEGDFVLAIVLGEIAHHNICHYYSKGKPSTSNTSIGLTSFQAWDELEPCNAYSLSAATGIPRETIRRKISILVKKGWIQKHSSGGYVILPGINKNFSMDLNLENFLDLMETSDELRDIIIGKSIRNK